MMTFNFPNEQSVLKGFPLFYEFFTEGLFSGLHSLIRQLY